MSVKIGGIPLDRILHYVSNAQLARHRASVHTLSALLFLMCDRRGRSGKYWCRPSIRELSDMVGRCRYSIHIHLNVLEQAGLIRRRARAKKGYKLSNLYTPGPSLVAILDHLQKEASHGRSR